ncbi:hypothetical protein [Dactylosporangium sp. CA-092794]|uniref:hypothetical protein n=1 Tax=Dactylosporangium sp. CA-092794 TaxID=3239929 RepID=UPI003D8EF47D
MPANDERKARAARTQPLFAEFSRGRQAFSLIVAPAVFGVLMGLTIRWSGPAWWTLQAVGVLGAVVAGLEHRRLLPAAMRGAVGGLFAATAVVCVRAAFSGEDVTNFVPASFVATAVIASAVLHAGGAALRRRTTPATDAAPVP